MLKLVPIALIAVAVTSVSTAQAGRVKAGLERVGSLACEMEAQPVQQTAKTQAPQKAICAFNVFGGAENASRYEVTFQNLELSTAIASRFLFSVMGPTKQLSGQALSGTYNAREPTDETSQKGRAVKSPFVLVGGNADAFSIELLSPANQAVGAQTTMTMSVVDAS